MATAMRIRNHRNFKLIFRPKLFKNCQSLTTAELAKEDVVEYPPVKPRLPPGEWGSMDRKECWKWHDLGCELETKSNVEDKINLLTAREYRTWIFDVCQTIPRTYDYQQSVTKTHMVNNLPQIYDTQNVDVYVEKLKPLIKDAILLEFDKLERSKNPVKRNYAKRGSTHSSLLLKTILQTIHSVIVHNFSHLHFSQFDECVRVETFWDRHGIPKHFPKIYNKDHYVRPQNSRLQSQYIADFQIRLERPLPEFISREDNLCIEGKYPELKYWPTVLGQRIAVIKHSTLPGYKYGDPCEFGLLSVLNMNDLIKSETEFGQEHANSMLKGYGMASSFVWLVAQAYNQGFNMCQELTYPFTTQTIISDGRRFSFFAYQLNTLLLWKDDDANPLRNICWHSGIMNLYDRIENDELVGFNDDVLKQLVKCMALRPTVEDFDTRPYLSKEVPDRTKKFDFVNFKVDEVAEDEEQVFDES